MAYAALISIHDLKCNKMLLWLSHCTIYFGDLPPMQVRIRKMWDLIKQKRLTSAYRDIYNWIRATFTCLKIYASVPLPNCQSAFHLAHHCVAMRRLLWHSIWERLNIKMPSCQYRDSHYNDHLILIMVIPIPGKTVLLSTQGPGGWKSTGLGWWFNAY